MRTTVRLDDDLLRQTKTLAAQTGRTLTAVIEDALRETIAPRCRPSRVTGSGLVSISTTAPASSTSWKAAVILPDVNVLVYAYREDAPRHERYRHWLEGVLTGRESYGVSDLVLAGFVRVVTHPRV